MLRKLILFVIVPLFLFSCSEKSQFKKPGNIDKAAELYVRLVLITGNHDKDYVDAYFGPDSLKKIADSSKMTLKDLSVAANELLFSLNELKNQEEDSIFPKRKAFLRRQLSALITKLELLKGKKMSFDAESHALYDVVSPIYNIKIYDDILAQLNAILPGQGDIAQRVESFRRNFIVPPHKIDTCFKTAIEECRKRTLSKLKLPKNEKFTIEYVKDKPWGAYNWFKGNSLSLIQVNTGLPVYVDRMISLAAHEGYPGHHVFHSSVESELYRKRNWVEFSVYPLFTPMSTISEGLANYGIELLFPGNEKLEFEKKRIYPLAGLDPSLAELYARINILIHKLSFAGNEVARRYLDGNMSRERAVEWLMKYDLMSSQRAERHLKFIEKYRSYVVTYNVGEQLIKKRVEVSAGKNLQWRWKNYLGIMLTLTN